MSQTPTAHNPGTPSSPDRPPAPPARPQAGSPGAGQTIYDPTPVVVTDPQGRPVPVGCNHHCCGDRRPSDRDVELRLPDVMSWTAGLLMFIGVVAFFTIMHLLYPVFTFVIGNDTFEAEAWVEAWIWTAFWGVLIGLIGLLVVGLLAGLYRRTRARNRLRRQAGLSA